MKSIKALTLLALLFISCESSFDTDDRNRIMASLAAQVESWNSGDIDGFMKAYLNNDSLMFIGSGGLNYGYKTTLENYKKAYSNQEKMGQLSFEIFHLKPLNSDNALVIGAWRLDRTSDTLGGAFSLNWQRIDGDWIIIADHSSSD